MVTRIPLESNELLIYPNWHFRICLPLSLAGVSCGNVAGEFAYYLTFRLLTHFVNQAGDFDFRAWHSCAVSCWIWVSQLMKLSFSKWFSNFQDRMCGVSQNAARNRNALHSKQIAKVRESSRASYLNPSRPRRTNDCPTAISGSAELHTSINAKNGREQITYSAEFSIDTWNGTDKVVVQFRLTTVSNKHFSRIWCTLRNHNYTDKIDCLAFPERVAQNNLWCVDSDFAESGLQVYYVLASHYRWICLSVKLNLTSLQQESL